MSWINTDFVARNIFLKGEIVGRKGLTGIYIGLAAALIAVSAFIRIPTQPVALTMQVFIIFLVPILFGTKVAFFGFLLYLGLGFIGLPIFSSGGGIGYVLMPTFGYLLGFLIATIPVGVICDKIKGYKGYALAGVTFMLIYNIFGAAGLYFNINYVQNKEMSVSGAIIAGVLPFILPDVLKIVGAVSIAPVLRKVFKNLRIEPSDAATIKI